MTINFNSEAARLLVAKTMLGAGLALGFWQASEALAEVHQLPQEQCQEDQACWDCTTMGNQVCGPTQVDMTQDSTWGLAQAGMVAMGGPGGELVDCTVRDSWGHRAALLPTCDPFWEGDNWVGGYN